MKIALLGNYPPKACGIGTFTHSLALALAGNFAAEEVGEHTTVIVMEDADDGHDYPPEVGLRIRPHVVGDYRRAADFINAGDFDVLIVQHEYGIFGGQDGAFLLHLTDRVRIPMVATLHTVLKAPNSGQRNVLQRLTARVQRVIVMSRLAHQLLQDVFGVDRGRIDIIEHGVPVIQSPDRHVLRTHFGWTERRVLFTFGLLGRGKGIETAIRALPVIARRYPEVLYVVLGKTHPHVLRERGEEYRTYLGDLATELGVSDNLRMISKFADEQELFDRLRAADIYVTPYPNEAQITSGTLAYAVGAGAAIVSTPFWHAAELLEEGRGRLFPFRDSEALADTVLNLFDNEGKLLAMRQRAADYGQGLLWPRIGQQYLATCERAGIEYRRHRPHDAWEVPPPEIKLDHLLRMTDDCGLLQHAKYAVANRHEGYCLDDNGRALLLVGMLAEAGVAARRAVAGLADTYLGYVWHAQREDGTFRNFMSYGREWLESEGSEDSFGRAFWGVCYCYAHPPAASQRSLLREIFDRAVVRLEGMRSPRTIAYGVIGLSYFLDHHPDQESRLNLLDRLVHRLLDHYRDSRHEDWHWFEGYLTYSNGILPLALWHALRHLDDPGIRTVARESTEFLARHTIRDGVLCPVGCTQPFLRGQAAPRFDQQPVDVMAAVLLFAEAARREHCDRAIARARIAFNWFTGQNDLKTAVYNPHTGGCCDGLMRHGLNANQGGESLLAYLISRVAIDGLRLVTDEEQQQQSARYRVEGARQ